MAKHPSLMNGGRGSARRTKKAYQELYDRPDALFGHGTRVMLWPNGQRELWIQDTTGRHSVKITVRQGPAGLGITLHQHVGATPMSVRVYGQDYSDAGAQPRIDDVREVNITMYNEDARSQAFKRWCDGQETEADLVILGEEYRRCDGPGGTAR